MNFKEKEVVQMQKIILATKSDHKIKEIQMYIKNHKKYDFRRFQFETLKDDGFEVEEDGDTILDNSIKKAVETAKHTGMPCLADDSGLFVGALNGKPGVISARWCGIHGDEKKNNEKLQKEMIMNNFFISSAYFETVMTYYDPDKDCMFSTNGRLDGFVYYFAKYGKDGDGYGYEPHFYMKDPRNDDTVKSLAEYTDEERLTFNYRFKALDKVMKYLKYGHL